MELVGTGECYAMKAMDKNVMLNRNKVSSIVVIDHVLEIIAQNWQIVRIPKGFFMFGKSNYLAARFKSV